MATTAMGFVSTQETLDDGEGQVNYAAIYTGDRSVTDYSQSGIAWPAHYMPIEYFGADSAWTYYFGEDGFDTSDITVTVTKCSDGTTWTMDSSSGGSSFYVGSGNFSRPDTIVSFIPSGLTIADGDIFNVTITGSDLPHAVDYDVNFFSTTDADITVTNTSFEARVGKRFYLSYELTPDSLDYSQVTCSSSDPSILRFDTIGMYGYNGVMKPAGFFTGISEGTVTVTIAGYGVSKSYTVNVVKDSSGHPYQLMIDEMSLDVGETAPVSYTTLPDVASSDYLTMHYFTEDTAGESETDDRQNGDHCDAPYESSGTLRSGDCF